MFNIETLGELIAILCTNRGTGSTSTIVRACRMLKFFHNSKHTEYNVPIILCPNNDHAHMLRKQYGVNACSISNFNYLIGGHSPILVERDALAMLATEFRELYIEKDSTIKKLEAAINDKDAEILWKKAIIKELQNKNADLERIIRLTIA